MERSKGSARRMERMIQKTSTSHVPGVMPSLMKATSAKRPKMLMPEIMRSTTRRVPGVMPNLMKATTGRPKVPIKEMMKSTSASRPRIPSPTMMNAVKRKTRRNKIR